jgi:hypothetical protein
MEYDSEASVNLEMDAAAIAADSGNLGQNIVYLTNSASGLRAQMAAVKSNTTNIKGIVCYEGFGYVFPDNAGHRARCWAQPLRAHPRSRGRFQEAGQNSFDSVFVR